MDKVRVTAELLAPETGEQLWSERYDRELDDLFAIQDGITTGLAGCITADINKAETRIRARLTDAELSAWDCFLRGASHWYAASNNDLVHTEMPTTYRSWEFELRRSPSWVGAMRLLERPMNSWPVRLA